MLGGTQSLHTNSYDEAIALPTEKAARLALRTQQVLANETDLTATVDPFAGSYAVESMTDEVEARRPELMRPGRGAGRRGRRDRAGLPEDRDRAVRVPDRAGDRLRRAKSSSASTSSASPSEEPYEPLRVDPAIEEQQAERLAALRDERDNGGVTRALDELGAAGGRDGQRELLYPMRDALRARATVGEVCDALREVWGVYLPPDVY